MGAQRGDVPWAAGLNAETWCGREGLGSVCATTEHTQASSSLLGWWFG